MPLYKEQGVVLRSVKLGEADKIVTVMTQGSGKVRAVAKGIRKTHSRFGARLEPFTHVSLMVYRGRGALDTVSQAEIISPFMELRRDLGLFAAGETMLEATDKVAEEHERNVRLFLLLLGGLRALDTAPADPAAVAESFLLKLLSLSGFHPSLTACAFALVLEPTPGSRYGALEVTLGKRPVLLRRVAFFDFEGKKIKSLEVSEYLAAPGGKFLPAALSLYDADSLVSLRVFLRHPRISSPPSAGRDHTGVASDALSRMLGKGSLEARIEAAEADTSEMEVEGASDSIPHP